MGPCSRGVFCAPCVWCSIVFCAPCVLCAMCLCAVCLVHRVFCVPCVCAPCVNAHAHVCILGGLGCHTCPCCSLTGKTRAHSVQASLHTCPLGSPLLVQSKPGGHGLRGITWGFPWSTAPQPFQDRVSLTLHFRHAQTRTRFTTEMLTQRHTQAHTYRHTHRHTNRGPPSCAPESPSTPCPRMRASTAARIAAHTAFTLPVRKAASTCSRLRTPASSAGALPRPPRASSSPTWAREAMAAPCWPCAGRQAYVSIHQLDVGKSESFAGVVKALRQGALARTHTPTCTAHAYLPAGGAGLDRDASIQAAFLADVARPQRKQEVREVRGRGHCGDERRQVVQEGRPAPVHQQVQIHLQSCVCVSLCVCVPVPALMYVFSPPNAANIFFGKQTAAGDGVTVPVCRNSTADL